MKNIVKANIRIKGNKEFWETPIDALDLSQRPFGALKRVRINTIEELTNRWNQLDKIQNLGIKSEREIRNKLIGYYLDVANDEKIQNFIDDLGNAKKVPSLQKAV